MNHNRICEICKLKYFKYHTKNSIWDQFIGKKHKYLCLNCFTHIVNNDDNLEKYGWFIDMSKYKIN